MEGYSTKVLIVDDDASARKILQSRLRSMNVQVLIASGGSEALEQIRQETPAVVLLDLQMPKMSGIDVLRSLKREGLEATVIVVTAHATIETAVEAMKEGAYDFITKPVDVKHLEIVLGKAFERESLRAQSRFLQTEMEGRLVQVVTEILGKNKAGFSLAKLSEKVLATGYKSSSHDFKNVLYQCLYNTTSIVHDAESGTYRLK